MGGPGSEAIVNVLRASFQRTGGYTLPSEGAVGGRQRSGPCRRNESLTGDGESGALDRMERCVKWVSK